MSESIGKVVVISYQNLGRPILKEEDKETFEFCCWDSLFKWLQGFPILNKCENCKNEQSGNK